MEVEMEVRGQGALAELEDAHVVDARVAVRGAAAAPGRSGRVSEAVFYEVRKVVRVVAVVGERDDGLDVESRAEVDELEGAPA